MFQKRKRGLPHPGRLCLSSSHCLHHSDLDRHPSYRQRGWKFLILFSVPLKPSGRFVSLAPSSPADLPPPPLMLRNTLRSASELPRRAPLVDHQSISFASVFSRAGTPFRPPWPQHLNRRGRTETAACVLVVAVCYLSRSRAPDRSASGGSAGPIHCRTLPQGQRDSPQGALRSERSAAARSWDNAHTRICTRCSHSTKLRPASRRLRGHTGRLH